MAMLTDEQVRAIGFASVGSGVQISDKASFYGAFRIHIGNHVRIDDFCVLSSGKNGIVIGNYIHIAVFSSLIGAGKIQIDDFCNISSRVSIYSSNDDYCGLFMTNPMVPKDLTNVQEGDVLLEKHVIVGSGSIILPGVTLGCGVAVGALSLVKADCSPFGIYAGNPAIFIKERKKNILELEKKILTFSNISKIMRPL